jgi:hypothetical protein
MDQRLIAYLDALGVDPDALDGWAVHTAQRDGQDVGFVVQKGPELHMLSLSERKAMSRRNIVEFINPVLDEFGYVTTRVPTSETNHRLRVCLGFEQTWQDHQFTYWALTKIPFERGVS